jgi:SEC-C motif domain protein
VEKVSVTNTIAAYLDQWTNKAKQPSQSIVMKFVLSVLFLSLFLCTAWALAVNNKKGKTKGKRIASSRKGFGLPPPTLEETLQSFKTRIPENAITMPCPCGTGLLYGECCAPIHSGEKLSLSPLTLLRSRYTAFCNRDIGYVMKSTHKTCRDYKEDKVAWAKSLDKNGMFDSYDFIALHVQGGTEEMGNNQEAFIEFNVELRAKDSQQTTVVTERSRFLCQDDGQWLYAGGDVRSLEKGVDDIILNP